MPSILPEYEYDIFISYRQNDNRSGWVTEFVNALQDELAATLKEPVSIYFDSNPHDGLQDHHEVDDSLKQKLKSLIFIPIVSRTYCDENSFAWNNEFKVFLDQVKDDEQGLKVNISGGNVANRVLPVRIHELDTQDVSLFESCINGVMRPIDFIYKESGVNRALQPGDDKKDNVAGIDYRNQVNKVANAVNDIISHMKMADTSEEAEEKDQASNRRPITEKLRERNVLRAGIMYIMVGLLLWKTVDITAGLFNLPSNIISAFILILIIGFPVAMALAWRYERSPIGFVRVGSKASEENPFSRYQKKPLTSNAYMLILLASFVALLIIFPGSNLNRQPNLDASKSSVAILPFLNMTGDESLDAYGFGLASEIRTQLSLTKQFDFLSSLQATLAYKNSNESPQVIGENLGVTHILSGIYQGTKDNLQVMIELVEASSGKLVWSLPYNSRYQDVFKLQASIAQTVMQKFSNESINTPVATFDLEAYGYYNQGMMLRESGGPRRALQAAPYFEKAIALDSTLLSAWVGLIYSYSYYYFNFPEDTVVTLEKINPLVDYLDKNFEDSWEKNEALGAYAYWIEKDYQRGYDLLSKVNERNPESIIATSLMGAIKRRRMEYREALRLKMKDVKISGTAESWRELGSVWLNNGDLENAELAFRNSVKVNEGTGYALYNLLYQQNRLEELPVEIKKQYGNTYKADLLMLKRDYEGLMDFVSNPDNLDSTFNEQSVNQYKSDLFYHLGDDDSMKYYSDRFNEIRRTKGMLPFRGRGELAMLAASGERDEFDSLRNVYWPEVQRGQDLFAELNYRFVDFLYSITSREYETATQQLQAMNRDFPEWGYWQFLYIMPEFDRTKKEYPAFQQAIDNLKLPPKLSELDQARM